MYGILALGVSLPLGVGDGVGPSGPGVGVLGQVGILQHWSLGSVVMKQDCGRVANLEHLKVKVHALIHGHSKRVISLSVISKIYSFILKLSLIETDDKRYAIWFEFS